LGGAIDFNRDRTEAGALRLIAERDASRLASGLRIGAIAAVMLAAAVMAAARRRLRRP